ncbi:hypothetical protein [Maribellus maritimus]|uniref:hypothetical protein n=1 Tax=Maribellus maritimus TaxID=2870838 RepID=UPI001EEAB127|nr:hypothetical protein [Maribellus maritimus]MCG6188229.1 hypothetical protein [Maribellus maritimus]
MKRLLHLLFLFSMFISCNEKNDQLINTEPEPELEAEVVDSSYVGFNMYFLKDESLTGADVSNADINKLELLKPPFVAQGNIELYDTSVHAIYLNKSVDFPELGISVYGRPFVVAIDSVRHYTGVIWPGYSSTSYKGPVIDVMPRLYPHDIIKISTGRIPMEHDFRMNDTIIQTLRNYEIFHAGIDCSIDSVKIIENDSINNRCKLRYTFTIKNNDELNLYVFDPLIMGEAHFHYYHNGVFLRTTEKIYQSTSGSQAPAESDNPLDWMIRLNSGETITRTVQKSGYPFIPKGTYECGFRFSGIFSLKKPDREKPDGRVWMGDRLAKSSAIIN